MSITVCLLPSGALNYINGGGYIWIFLNWALGFRAIGCQVIWLEAVNPKLSAHEIQARANAFKSRLTPYNLADSLALCSWNNEPLPDGATEGCLNFDDATKADLLLNQQYGASPSIVKRFRRSALLDIDPGLLQTWMSKKWVSVAPHDVYFTIGETVGKEGAFFPNLNLSWQHTPPCVALEWWTIHPAAKDAAFTTLAHWYAGGGTEDTAEAYSDDKRNGFLPFLDLPRRTTQALELALDITGKDTHETKRLKEHGWRVRDAYTVAAAPWDFKQYVQGSLGEFSCAKPSYVRLETAWISDRTVCYLGSGKPVVVQHTGRSRFLPDAEGIFRFRDVTEAAKYIETVAADYERQCKIARSLAEEYFDAHKIARSVLERAGI